MYLLLENLEAFVIVVACNKQIVYASDKLKEILDIRHVTRRKSAVPRKLYYENFPHRLIFVANIYMISWMTSHTAVSPMLFLSSLSIRILQKIVTHHVWKFSKNSNISSFCRFLQF